MAMGMQIDGRTIFNKARNEIQITSSLSTIDLSNRIAGEQILFSVKIDSFVKITGTTIENSANSFKVAAGEVFDLLFLGSSSYIISGRPTIGSNHITGEIKYLVYTANKVNNYYRLNGQAISRSENPSLFLIWGTTFGVGDGSTTFNLPNLDGRTLATINSLHAINSFAGEEAHVLSIAEIPTHNHSGTTNTDGAHSHSLESPATSLTGDSITNTNGGDGDANAVNATLSAGSHSHSFSTNSVGNNQAHNNLQPTAYLGSWYVLSL